MWYLKVHAINKIKCETCKFYIDLGICYRFVPPNFYDTGEKSNCDKNILILRSTFSDINFCTYIFARYRITSNNKFSVEKYPIFDSNCTGWFNRAVENTLYSTYKFTSHTCKLFIQNFYFCGGFTRVKLLSKIIAHFFD